MSEGSATISTRSDETESGTSRDTYLWHAESSEAGDRVGRDGESGLKEEGRSRIVSSSLLLPLIPHSRPQKVQESRFNHRDSCTG